MKKFARCVLILIFVIIVSGVCGYFYEDKTLTTMYTSTTQLYVVPGEENEATVRAVNGGLKDDFIIVFKSNVVIQEAQRIAGTSEDIASYLTVSSPANSNIVEITCTNPDQNTAKQYVDAVAKTALKTTSIIPVKSIQILSEGTSTNTPVKPDLYRNTLMIAGACGAVCAVLEIIIVLILCAFKKPEDHSDDEFEYEKYYGKYAALRAPQPQQFDDKKHEEEKREDDNVKQSHEPQPQKKHSEPQEMKDILEDFDEDYAEEDEDVFADDALEDEDEPEEAKALQEAAITQEETGQEQDSQMKVSQQEEKQEAAETSEDTHPDTEEDVFADATSDDDKTDDDKTDDEFDGDILEGDVVEDNDSDDDVIQEDVVEEDIVEDVSDEAAAAETGTDKAKVAEVPEETAIDIYRVGQQSSSRVIARIQK